MHPEPVTKDDEFALLLSRPIIFQNCFPNNVRFCAAIFYIFPIFLPFYIRKVEKSKGGNEKHLLSTLKASNIKMQDLIIL